MALDIFHVSWSRDCSVLLLCWDGLNVDNRVLLCWPLGACGFSVDAAAGLRWICGRLLVAVVCQHFLRSPVQLQGRDSGDILGELRFPPHQWALSTLIFYDLDTERAATFSNDTLYPASPIFNFHTVVCLSR